MLLYQFLHLSILIEAVTVRTQYLAPSLLPRQTPNPSTNQCTQPSLLDVRQLYPAFQKGLGRISVLKGDPHSAEMFRPSLFDSMMDDFRCESQVKFVSQLDHDPTFLYDGSIAKLAFDADAFTISNMDTVENDDKEIHFTGYFRNFKVNCCFHTSTF
jgi:hypothetical protein